MRRVFARTNAQAKGPNQHGERSAATSVAAQFGASESALSSKYATVCLVRVCEPFVGKHSQGCVSSSGRLFVVMPSHVGCPGRTTSIMTFCRSRAHE